MTDGYNHSVFTEPIDDFHNRSRILSNSDCEHPEATCDYPPVLPHSSSTSAWGYLKLLIWNIIVGLLRCGTSLLETPFADQWPVASNSVILREAVTVSQSDEEKEISAVKQVDSEHTIEGSVILVAEEIVAPSEVPLEVVVDNRSSVRDIFKTGSDCRIHNSSDLVNRFHHSWFHDVGLSFNLSEDFVPCDEPLSDCSAASSPPCTFLSSLYADSKNGLIDNDTLNLSIEELIQSVIPRNLSDCSETAVTPAMRKMYAWADTRSDISENDQNDKPPDNLDLNSTRSISDEPFAYPGRLTMSDGSFSPLSPATTDSSTLTCPYSSISEDVTDFGIHGIDKQDHTLAWAMASLNATYNERDEHEVTSRPPLPNSLNRQSRDKSPARTVNSLRLTDTMSVPALLPYDAYQLLGQPFDEDDVTAKPKRSSSLKSQRTPPGTPGQKAVRFADALGLDLETVRHVFDQEAPPKIPASATFDLELDSDESIARLGAKQFGLCFAQPGASSSFIRRVLNEMICLEDVQVSMPRGVLTGTVRVRSLGFEKRIYVRITYNNWATYFDTMASYVHGSHDGATDRFAFSVVFPDTMVPGDRAQFALRYETHTGDQFWDNNHGQNYSVSCYAKATDLAGDGSWVHYL